MNNPRDVLTPDALSLLQTIAQAGSFAAAARARNMVPSALTYRVRQIEEALDVLLFDRSTRQAKLTEAGAELLREGSRLLADMDAVTHRVKRVATGWEPQFTIAMDGVIDRTTMMELCEQFFALDPPTRLKLRDETLSGTLEALTGGQADLALGVIMDAGTAPGLGREPLGSIPFVFVVPPHHPLAALPEPLGDDALRQYRAVAVADSIQRGDGLTIGLLAGQDVFTVADLPTKLEAQLRGLGVGFLPLPLVKPYVDSGRLVAKRVVRGERRNQVSYAWRSGGLQPQYHQGRALQWWLEQLKSPVTRRALLGERIK